ncbi:Hypothetical protein D9617_4g004430 [Elsinoe fawcettii]|nr:Hypothetical protein D9617_4g004430 [Elsinoe fawcettii]
MATTTAADHIPQGVLGTKRRHSDLSLRPRKKIFRGLRQLQSTIPLSAFRALHESDSTTETDALLDLTQDERKPYTMVDLVDFTIYRSPEAAVRPYEMVPLHTLKVDVGLEGLCFDGKLCIDGAELPVRGVYFETLSIHGYGSRHIPSVRSSISVQSERGSCRDVWYRLASPSDEYRRYHDAYLWVADLAKYVVDYLMEHQTITLEHFHGDFYNWLCQVQSKTRYVQKWLSAYKNNHDFRAAIVANIHYIWKEAYDVVPHVNRHPIWTEADHNRLDAIPKHYRQSTSTVVTPFIHEMFNNMSFAPLLTCPQRQQPLATQVRRKQLKLTPATTLRTATPRDRPNPATAVAPDDVVYIKPDKNTHWRHSDRLWIALIQKVRKRSNGRAKLDLLWLYRPTDTSIGPSYYPFQNELFLSDNCSCGDDAYDLQDVVGIANVCWGVKGDPARAARKQRWLIRQTYMTAAHEFVTLQPDHFVCGCQSVPNAFAEAVEDYKEGDFVLYRKGNLERDGLDVDSILQPAQILAFLYTTHKLRIRVLHKARYNDPNAPPNQVVWTNDTIDTPAYNMVRRCQVEGFRSSAVPEVFRRGGAGDLFFYISDSQGRANISSESPVKLPSLRGMGLCCGGGSFDRGLEDGGAIHFKHAIDFDSTALHTYRANADKDATLKLFLGPMEMYLGEALKGNSGSALMDIAAVGDVDVIAAGSPCQSFSILQSNRHSTRSLKHASLIACVLSYVDHYMPLYFYLENVVSIANVAKGVPEDQNMMRKIIATLVALGYQVQQNVLDAPSYGSFQSRRRVIVTATAPALMPPHRPPQTHLSKPTDEQFRTTSLGRLSNGERFGTSQDELAPFETITFQDGTKDLPDIGDGHTYTCIEFPDHRQGGARLSYEQRCLIPQIPQYPRGMGLAATHALGKIPGPQAQRWLSNRARAATSSKSFSRVRPESLLTTITTGMHTIDAFTGTCIHPDQHRLLTVMEARRAQGFPDHEVILGGREQQWKIIGNSVHRNVALALGISLRQAWEKSQDIVKRHQITPATIPRTARTSEYAISSEVARGIAREIEQDGQIRRRRPLRAELTKVMSPLATIADSMDVDVSDIEDMDLRPHRNHVTVLDHHVEPADQLDDIPHSLGTPIPAKGNEVPQVDRLEVPASKAMQAIDAVCTQTGSEAPDERSEPVIPTTRFRASTPTTVAEIIPSIPASGRSTQLQDNREQSSLVLPENVADEEIFSNPSASVFRSTATHVGVQGRDDTTITESTTTTITTTTTTTMRVTKTTRRGSAKTVETMDMSSTQHR